MIRAVPPSLSVVLPAWNEAARLDAALRGVAELRAVVPDVEVLLVDDGSADGTAQLAQAAGLRTIVHPENRGKGAAVRTGMLAATGLRRLFCDVDPSTPLVDVLSMLAALDAGADLAVGRREPSGRRSATVARRRAALSHTFRGLTRLIGVGVHDSQCGFKLFTGAAAEAIFSRTRVDRYAFDVEVLLVARELGLRVVEVPVRWGDAAGSRLVIGTDGPRMLVDSARVLVHRAAGHYR